jgi:hypothetical protein
MQTKLFALVLLGCVFIGESWVPAGTVATVGCKQMFLDGRQLAVSVRPVTVRGVSVERSLAESCDMIFETSKVAIVRLVHLQPHILIPVFLSLFRYLIRSLDGMMSQGHQYGALVSPYKTPMI